MGQVGTIPVISVFALEGVSPFHRSGALRDENLSVPALSKIPSLTDFNVS